MDNSRFLKIVIIFLLLINAGTLAFLWLHKPGGREPHNPHSAADFIIHELQFTETQRDQYEALIKEHRRGVEAYEEENRSRRNTLFNMLKLSSPDSNVITETTSAIAGNQKQIELLTFYHFQKVRNICTPEQQPKFDAVIGEAIRKLGPPRPGN